MSRAPCRTRNTSIPPAGNRSIEDEVITETGDGEVSQIRIERLMRFVMRAYAGHGGQTGEGRFGFGEKAIGDLQAGLAGVIAEGRDQITVRRRAADDPTHGRIVSPASPSSASRRRAAQSSFVIGVAGPLSNASRNLASSACLA